MRNCEIGAPPLLALRHKSLFATLRCHHKAIDTVAPQLHTHWHTLVILIICPRNSPPIETHSGDLQSMRKSTESAKGVNHQHEKYETNIVSRTIAKLYTQEILQVNQKLLGLVSSLLFFSYSRWSLVEQLICNE